MKFAEKTLVRRFGSTKVKDVSTKRVGCDFFVDGREYEIKGTKSPREIPDTDEHEFTEDGVFLPDFLWIVRFLPGKPPKLDEVSNDEVNKFQHKRLIRWRFSSQLKTALLKESKNK
ncbi:MAG: hypothetical protein AABX01_03650 [Candidatus Micrarchaeota archaeon]